MSILNVNTIQPIGSGTTVTVAATELKTSNFITVGTGASITSPSANVLTLGTNTAERLRITSDGSVAIGVNSPSDKLHVGGNNAFIRVDRPNGNPGLTLIYNSTNSTRADIDVTTGGDLRFATNSSTERFRVTSGGVIQCGTSAVLKAEINNAVSGHQFISQCSDNNNGFEIYQQHGSTTSRNTLAVYDNRTGAKSASFVVRGDGNTGIGTDNPLNGLDVNQSEGRLRVNRFSHLLMQNKNNSTTDYWGISVRNGGELDIGYGTPDGNGLVGGDKLTITSDGKFGFGTSSPSSLLHGEVSSGAATLTLKSTATSGEASVALTGKNSSGTSRTGIFKYDNGDLFRIGTAAGIALRFETNDTTRVYLANNGFIGLQGATSSGGVSSGKTFYIQNDGHCHIAVDNTIPLFLNRNNSDGQIIAIRQNNTLEGNISVSGSTVSLQGAHLTRWSQLVGISTNVISDRPTILRGSVLSNLDEMCEWGDEDNEQLNCMKVSDVEGDVNVAGVFQDWDDDDDTYTNDLNCAMTGDFVIRIAQGTTVARGDLLMSAGDGTAKPQGDDIIRSKTIAKVTSTTVSTTYSDGSYCVPCVLMAC